MHIHLQNSAHICIMIGLRNKPQIILIFPTILIHSTPRILTNSCYRFNNTDVTFSQDHPQTLKMKSYQKLSPTSYLVGMVLGSILMLCHRVLITSPKLLTHVEGVALNTSVHQYCVISIAPPTGHRK